MARGRKEGGTRGGGGRSHMQGGGVERVQKGNERGMDGYNKVKEK